MNNSDLDKTGDKTNNDSLDSDKLKFTLNKFLALLLLVVAALYFLLKLQNYFLNHYGLIN